MSQIRFINPQALGKPPGYTHVVEITAPGRIVYIAGQLGIDREGKLGSDIGVQAVPALDDMEATPGQVGADFRNVLEFNNYLGDRVRLPTLREKPSRYVPAYY